MLGGILHFAKMMIVSEYLLTGLVLKAALNVYLETTPLRRNLDAEEVPLYCMAVTTSPLTIPGSESRELFWNGNANQLILCCFLKIEQGVSNEHGQLTDSHRFRMKQANP